MAILRYKSMTPGRRLMTHDDFSDITTDEPCKSLIKGAKKKGGRNCYGRLTSPRRGGGSKRRFRQIDFRRDKHGINATVKSIEYDPNRTARIALLNYSDGEKRYIVAPEGMKVGEKIMASRNAEIKMGNCLPLSDIPTGTMIHNIELQPGSGAKMVRSAGSMAQLLAKEGDWAHLRLPSGEVRMVSNRCRAVIGQVSNADHSNVRIGKAGRTRWQGIRPRVRAIAKNPVDHPMGGGEGRTKGGRHPCSFKGQPAKGFKTRKNKRTGRFIVKRRGKK